MQRPVHIYPYICVTLGAFGAFGAFGALGALGAFGAFGCHCTAAYPCGSAAICMDCSTFVRRSMLLCFCWVHGAYLHSYIQHAYIQHTLDTVTNRPTFHGSACTSGSCLLAISLICIDYWILAACDFAALHGLLDLACLRLH